MNKKVKERTKIECWENCRVSKLLIEDVRKCTSNTRRFLGIPNAVKVEIVLVRARDCPNRAGQEVHKPEVDKDGNVTTSYQIILNLVGWNDFCEIRQRPVNEILETLCHELVHVAQDVRGDFGPPSKQGGRFRLRWKGRIYKFKNTDGLTHKQYEALPWEREARMFAPILVEDYLMHRRFIK